MFALSGSGCSLDIRVCDAVSPNSARCKGLGLRNRFGGHAKISEYNKAFKRWLNCDCSKFISKRVCEVRNLCIAGRELELLQELLVAGSTVLTLWFLINHKNNGQKNGRQEARRLNTFRLLPPM